MVLVNVAVNVVAAAAGYVRSFPKLQKSSREFEENW